MHNTNKGIFILLLVMSLTAAGCGIKTPSGTLPEPERTAADQSSAAETEESSSADRQEPVYGSDVKDGVYGITVDSSSSMFRITSCELTVRDGKMSAVMAMSGTGYLKLYMGKGEEAERASEKACIPYTQAENGSHTFEIPVEALDMEIDCSAFSKKKEKWYDRVLIFRSGSLPPEAFKDGKITTAKSLELEDGLYTVEVALKGGSGRACVESPAAIRIEDGNAYAVIIWGSSNYDYMKVNGEKYEQMGTEGNSAFEIPVGRFDWNMPVIADTIAMSQPHEVEYTMVFDSSTLKKAE